MILCGSPFFMGDKMSIVRKTVALFREQYRWLSYHFEAGLFAQISERIRHLIWRAQVSPEEIEAIRRELIKGEQSPIVPFDPEEFEKEMIEKYG